MAMICSQLRLILQKSPGYLARRIGEEILRELKTRGGLFASALVGELILVWLGRGTGAKFVVRVMGAKVGIFLEFAGKLFVGIDQV